MYSHPTLLQWAIRFNIPYLLQGNKYTTWKNNTHSERNVKVWWIILKFKAGTASAWAQPLKRISACIIMTHTQSIINLACIVRKHESSHVIKVLLVVLLSSLCPDAFFVLPGRCWSFTERALIRMAAWLLTYCLYVQSWLIMKSVGRTEMNKLKCKGGNMESTLTVIKDLFKLNWGYFMICWTASMWLKLRLLGTEGEQLWLLLQTSYKEKAILYCHVPNVKMEASS